TRRTGSLHPQRRQRDPQPVSPSAQPRPGAVRVSAPGRQRAGAGARLQHGVSLLPPGALRAARRAAGGLLMSRPRRPATEVDEARSYAHGPSFVDQLPWVEYLPDSQCFLLEDNRSVGALFELRPIGTEGRERDWLMQARDAIEGALQDSFTEHDSEPWVAQFFCQDDTDFAPYLQRLGSYVRERARGSAFTEAYLGLIEKHLAAISRPGGLFEDRVVTQLPWRGRQRRVRLVIYRRCEAETESPEQALNHVCELMSAALHSGGVVTRRLDGRGFFAWLLPWFNPAPTLTDEPAKDFYRRICHPEPELEPVNGDALELPFDHDFAERLFFSEPRADSDQGLWYFDHQPHRVMVVDRLRRAPRIGQLCSELPRGDALNALFDQLPEGCILSLTLVIKPQVVLEAQLTRLSRKAMGENLASTQTREDVETARAILGRQHKLYRGTLAFYLRGADAAELRQSSTALANVLLGAGLETLHPADDVAACNTYLRWLLIVHT